jgi:hypothetical protein
MHFSLISLAVILALQPKPACCMLRRAHEIAIAPLPATLEPQGQDPNIRPWPGPERGANPAENWTIESNAIGNTFRGWRGTIAPKSGLGD